MQAASVGGAAYTAATIPSASKRLLPVTTVMPHGFAWPQHAVQVHAGACGLVSAYACSQILMPMLPVAPPSPVAWSTYQVPFQLATVSRPHSQPLAAAVSLTSWDKNRGPQGAVTRPTLPVRGDLPSTPGSPSKLPVPPSMGTGLPRGLHLQAPVAVQKHDEEEIAEGAKAPADQLDMSSAEPAHMATTSCGSISSQLDSQQREIGLTMMMLSGQQVPTRSTSESSSSSHGGKLSCHGDLPAKKRQLHVADASVTRRKRRMDHSKQVRSLPPHVSPCSTVRPLSVASSELLLFVEAFAVNLLCLLRTQRPHNRVLTEQGWCKEEDELIMQYVTKHGPRWSLLSSKHLKGRSDDAVRNRYLRLLRKAGLQPAEVNRYILFPYGAASCAYLIWHGAYLAALIRPRPDRCVRPRAPHRAPPRACALRSHL